VISRRTSRPRRAATLLAVAALGAFAFLARPSGAAIVERVVAVVGERPILLSELRHRAKPFLARIIAQTQGAAQQAAAESEMYRELLNRMVDDRLEETAADKARLQITVEEIDRAMQNVAAQAKVTTRELLAEAKKNGLSEQDYREELRRQLLEGKLVQLRVRGRVRPTDQDARAAYGRWVKSLGTDLPLDVRVLAMRIPNTEDGPRTREVLAEEIVKRARAGEDFCGLVKDYSDDATTKAACGSRGPQPANAYLPAIAEEVRKMKAGEISGPVHIGNEAIVVLQLVTGPSVPAFEDVRDAMYDRATSEAMERQRKAWLEELRRGVYVDVRL
jgi:peptidyl-prolyl cis-trans isomerase SurA